MKALISSIFIALFLVACVPSSRAAAEPAILDGQPISACGGVRLIITPNDGDEILAVYRAVFSSGDVSPDEEDYVDTDNVLHGRFDYFEPITEPHFVWYKVETTSGTSYSGQIATYVCDFTPPSETPEPTPEASATPSATVTPETTTTPEASATPEATVTPEATTTPEPTKSNRGGLAKTGC